MLYLVSYENAEPGQDALIRRRLAQRGARQILDNVWIVDSPRDTVLTVLWSINLGPAVRILVADVSHAHFASQPQRDIRALFRPAPAPEPAPSLPGDTTPAES
jgi:hypothetical protein